jgi:hypothetical protein
MPANTLITVSSHLLPKNPKIKIPLHKTIISTGVSYGCETWSLLWRKEHRSKESENRWSWRISGSRRGKITGKCRKLHTKEFVLFT